MCVSGINGQVEVDREQVVWSLLGDRVEHATEVGWSFSGVELIG